MRLPASYNLEQKLKSLCERLKYLVRNKNSYKNYNEPKIKSENLRFNISLIVSHIILNLDFIDRSKDVFLKTIEEYNQRNHAIITFENFERINWIRIVAGEAIIPELVRNFVWQVGNYESQRKTIEVPKDKEQLIKCLQLYSQRYFEDSKLTITKENLESILTELGTKKVTIDFLTEREIIGFDSKKELYYWKGNEYARHLRNEIASTIWLLIGSQEATEVEFRKFFKLIQGTEILIDDLHSYLSYENTSKICELAVSFLNTENDLIKSDVEFNKIWLDANSYQHIDIRAETPTLEFNYESTFMFIESVNYHKWRFHDTFDYQRTRSFCYPLLQLIVHNDPKHPTPYQNVVSILKDTSRPFLVWTLYKQIPKEFPGVLPYLLTDSELIPIAFKQIDEIEIDDDLLSEQSNNDRRFEESCELKNQFWNEMFDLILGQLVSIHFQDKEAGEIIAKILTGAAEKVFSINSNDRNNIIRHNSIRERYDQSLKKLSNKRIDPGNAYALINPRLIFFILPSICNYLFEKDSKQYPKHTEFLNLSSGFVDLSIEILRLANLRAPAAEISQDQKEMIKNVSNGLISILERRVNQFYSAIEIDVQVYNSGNTEKRRAKRDINEFGFEIIDWGYLYLHFEKNKILKTVNDNFKGTLDFKTNADKYDDQNKEQFEKIKIYLKSLLLAFISINSNRNLFEIERLPVKTTLTKLENLIKKFALIYSIDELSKKRIDIFSEQLNVLGYGLYHQNLSSLLYRSINFFKNENQKKFVQILFAKTVDMGRMLSAINILDSKELRNIISKRIEEVKIEDFIGSSLTIIELERALIEAVNSGDYWDRAEPLLSKIEQHYKKIKHFDQNSEDLLFEVKLQLAFKEKNLDKLKRISIPKSEYRTSENNQIKQNKKEFFIALHKLYNEEKYNVAILQLESILSKEEENINYAFHLLRAQTLKAISRKAKLPINALEKWENFISLLNGDSKKLLVNFKESIEHNKIHYHISNNNFPEFELSISKLTDKFLYDEEILFKVFNFYLKYKMDDLAFKYIIAAAKYFERSEKKIPIELNELIENSEKADSIKIKTSLEKLLGFKPKYVISSLPSVHNGEKNLNEFVLSEVVQGLKNLIDKRTSITSIKKENELNDLLQVIMKSKFSLWGWNIPDQSRAGGSAKGTGAGETDFLIQSGGKNIALIEALILEGKDKSKTQAHILKTFDYVNYLERFYIVIYFKGVISNFDHTWEEYKADVLSVVFPDDLEIDKIKKFQDLKDSLEDVRQIKIAKTSHRSNVEMFHVMINLGV